MVEGTECEVGIVEVGSTEDFSSSEGASGADTAESSGVEAGGWDDSCDL